MKFEQYLIEKASKNTIVVDVQPMYENWIRFDIEEFTEFLNEQTNSVLYFFNGPDTVGDDTEDEIKYWLIENGLDEYKLRDITFVDKGYAFFRNLMDSGVGEHTIIKMIRYMFKKKVWDSRDIEDDEWEDVLNIDFKFVEDMLQYGDNINIPDIDIRTLRKHSGGYIVGGGKEECLKEVQILMSAFNIKAKEVKKFIY